MRKREAFLALVATFALLPAAALLGRQDAAPTTPDATPAVAPSDAVAPVATVAPAAVVTSTIPAERPLARALRERFEVLLIRDGVVLRPLARSADVVGIEISDGTIAVDGAVVDPEAVPDLVGEPEASLLLRLVDLDSEELHDLFAPAVLPSPMAPPVPGVLPAPPTAPTAPVPPPALRRGGSKVVFASSAVVEDDEEVDEVVAIGGSIQVRGRVLGDAVAIGGTAEIDGVVEGNVTAVGGPVEIGPNARIDGEVTSVGGEVDVADGAQVGRVNEVSAPWMSGLGGSWGEGWQEHIAEEIEQEILDAQPEQSELSRDLESLVHRGIFLVVMWLLAVLCATIAPRAFVRTGEVIAASPLLTPLIGFLTALLFLPLLALVGFLLFISILGIPLLALLPFVLVGFILAAVFGFCAALGQLGTAFEGRLGRNGAARAVLIALGFVLVGGLGIAADLLDLVDGASDVLWPVTVMLTFAYVCALLWAWLTGLGGLVLARFTPTTPIQPAWAQPAAWPATEPPITSAPYRTDDPVAPRWNEEEFLAAARAASQEAAAKPAEVLDETGLATPDVPGADPGTLDGNSYPAGAPETNQPEANQPGADDTDPDDDRPKRS